MNPPAISQKPDFCAVSGHRNEISPNFSLQVFKLLRKKKKKTKPLQNSVIKFGTDSSLPVYLPANLQYCLRLKTAEYPSSICIFISGRKMTNGLCFFFSCYTAFFKIFFVIGNNLHLCIIFNLVVLVPMFCHLWFSSLLTSVIFMIFRFYFIPFFKVIFSHQKADWVWFSHCISSPLPFLIAFGTIYSPHFNVNCVVFVTTQKTCKCWLMIAFNF